ncbi:MAG: FkbM family methyltransferase, partial [Bacteroidetes bacterium]
MNVEKELLAIIPKLLKAYDADKRGTNFDVGVGTFNFYCELFAKLGYSTIAIEPLPSQAVKSFIGNPKITLVEGCLLDKNGTVEIYSGVYNDTECTDVSSVNKDWWGITDKSQKKIVSSFTLQTLITQQNIKEISYFKIDTEGSEEPIILQFTSLHQTLLPKVIEFEYGGGSAKKEGKDGWANKYFTGTIQSIHTLKNLG